MSYSHIDPKRIVTLHAVERYAERVMKVDRPEEKEKIEAIASNILSTLIDAHPLALEIGNGEFSIPGQDYKICMLDGHVTTVSTFKPESGKAYYGGIMKSGKKIKKRKKSHMGPREKSVPIKSYKKLCETDW